MMNALEKNKNFSDKISQELNGVEIPALLREIIKPSRSILDLGCGEGGIIKAILDKFPSKKITGVDISPRRIDLLKKKFSNQRFLCEDISKTSLKKEKFDLIICTQAIEHVENDKILIEEFYRLSKNKKYLYVSSVIKKPWAIYKYRNRGKFVLDPTHEKEYSSEEEFKELFEKRFKLIKLKKYPVGRKVFFLEIRIPGYFIVESLWKKR